MLDPSKYSESDAATIDFATNKMGGFVENMVKHFVRAITEYKRTVKEKFNHDSQDPWVIFVVEDAERNVVDQKLIEVHLQKTAGIKSMRMTFNQIHK